jgi:epoxide hydrolase A/B
VTRLVDANGIQLAVTEAGDGPAVVLLHGFPELAYSWRHQLPALAGAGFRAIAYDQRGYGGSSKPEAVDAYGLPTLAADLVGLLDEEEIDDAVVVGHDWGSLVTWTTALLHPDRISRIVSLNVPYRGWCAGFPTIEQMTQDERLKQRFSYVLAFQESGRTEASFAKSPEDWLRRIYLGATADTEFLSDEELAVFVDAFTEGGLTGPLNWYRNIDENHEATERLENATITQPTLMVTAEFDPILPAGLAEGMERWVPNLTVEHVAGSGHWTQQEQPERVNDILLDYLVS